MNKNLLFIVTSAWFAACSPSRLISDKPLPLLKDTALASAHVGIHIYSIDEEKTIYDFQGDKYFVPASNTKIVSCYAALKYFGDSLVSVEVAENDTAVFVKPQGDPTILHPDYFNQPLISYLQQAAKPVYLIQPAGSVTPFGPGWSWNDYNYAYSTERSIFPVYGNIVKWVQERTGESPTLRLRTPRLRASLNANHAVISHGRSGIGRALHPAIPRGSSPVPPARYERPRPAVVAQRAPGHGAMDPDPRPALWATCPTKRRSFLGDKSVWRNRRLSKCFPEARQ